ncbi:MAG: hypothetical protein AABW84_02125 [Nanoarchaeota archaeon]
MKNFNEFILDKFIGIRVEQTAHKIEVKCGAELRSDGLALTYEGRTFVGFPYICADNNSYHYGDVEVPKPGIKPVAVIHDGTISGVIDYFDMLRLAKGKFSIVDLEALMLHGSKEN